MKALILNHQSTKLYKCLIFLFLLLIMKSIYANNFFLSPTFKHINIENPIPDTIFFEEKNIIPNYFKITASLKDDSTKTKSVIKIPEHQFVNNLDYKISFHNKITNPQHSYQHYIVINNPMIYNSLSIEYALFPEKYFVNYRLYEPITVSDSLKIKTIKKNWENFLLDNKNLNITGNKTISVAVSNQDNVDINQSLFLRIDGELSPNMMVQAQLNDSQSPISSEGDSRELSSLDQVYFKVYGKQYEIAFGDLDLEITGTQFINYNPKFEGLKISYFDKQEASIAAAISKGISTTIVFNGIEGKQGPYYLKPDNIYTNVQVLPGSETIWLNGLKVERGSDYKIDYNEGSIEFYLKHFISENSRIQASFQYSDEYYRKNTFLGTSNFYIYDKIKLGVTAVYQKDDKDKPLIDSFNEEDIEILKEIGDNQALVSGESYVGNGLGLYKKILINDKIIYEYAPNDSLADYNVYFTWFGQGQGDYIQVTPSRFDYVGDNLGQWKALKEINAPQLKTNYNFNLNYYYDYLEIYYETLLSQYDKNTFSAKDSDDDFSHIQHFQLSLKPDFDIIKPSLKTYFRYRYKNLYTFANIKESDDYFNFGSFISPDSLNNSEYYINLNTISYDFLSQETSFRFNSYEDLVKQNYLNLIQSIKQTKYSPAVNYQYNKANETDNLNKLNNEIVINEPSILYKYKKITLKSSSRYNKSTVFSQNENQTISGNKYNLYKNSITIDNLFKSGFVISYDYDNNDVFLNHWQKNKKSFTYSLQSYTQLNEHYITTLYSHREVKSYTEGSSDQTYDVAEIRTMNNFANNAIQFNSNYILKNLEYYPKSRELQYLGEGAGLYDSTGTWTENGDYDWITVTVGEPSKSIEVQTNFNIYTYPAQFNSNKNNFLKKINLETNISIIEQTESTNKLKTYLLYPSALMTNKSIYARQEFRQAIWYNIVKNKWISRYTYKNDKTLDNRYQTTDENQLYEHEFSLRLMKYLNSDFEKIFSYKNETDSRYNMKSKTYINQLDMRTSYSNNYIFNTSFGYEREQVNANQQYQKIARYVFSEDLMIFLSNKYRILSGFEIKYNKIKTPISTYLPFDKQKGANLRWSASINYVLNKISTIELSYSGYKYPSQDAFHQVKMEMRAEF